jgi:hypothetical protein
MALTSVFLSSIASAQAPTHAPAPAHTHAIAVPTPLPIMVPIKDHKTGATTGTAKLTPSDGGTAVDLNFRTVPHGQSLISIQPGKNCSEIVRGAPAVNLNPINGTTSHTIVAVPFSAFGKGNSFELDVKDATTRAQLAEACGRR